MKKNSTVSFVVGFLLINVVAFGIFYIANMWSLHIPYAYGFIYGGLLPFFVLNAILLAGLGIYKKQLGYYAAAGLLIVGFFVPFLLDSPIFKHEEYRQLAGEIKTEEFSEGMQTVELDKLPIVNEDLARNYADKVLGEQPSLGSQVTIGELTLQNVNGELYYIAPLEHSGFFKWFNNREGTPGYIKVNARKDNDVTLVTELKGEPLKLKYLSSAFLNSYLERYAFKVNNTQGLIDYSFEIDDEGRPHWVITKYDKVIGVNGKQANGTLIIDVQTGEAHEYSKEETPAWVDRVISSEIVVENLRYNGELVHGVFNFSGKDKLTLTEGVKVLYNGADCLFYTGVTSVSADESLVGFYLVNTRTGETEMYKVSGAIESAGMASAEGAVQQMKYTSTFPVLVNLQNQPTYFTTLLDKKGLVKNFAFVNVKNYNLVAVGDTIQQAYDNYVDILSRDSESPLTDSTAVEKMTGKVSRVGMTTKNDSASYVFLLENHPEVFIVAAGKNPTAALMNVGDEVELEYIKNSNQTTSIKTFKNKTLDGIRGVTEEIKVDEKETTETN